MVPSVKSSAGLAWAGPWAQWYTRSLPGGPDLLLKFRVSHVVGLIKAGHNRKTPFNRSGN